MKWLYRAIAVSLVLGLGITFSKAVHSRRAAVAAEQAGVNTDQVAAAQILAARATDPDVPSTAEPVATDPAKPEASADNAPAAANDAPPEVSADSQKSEELPTGALTQKEYGELVEKYNQLLRQHRFDEAKLIAYRACLLQPDNPLSELMVAKAKMAKDDSSQKLREQKPDETNSAPATQNPAPHEQTKTLIVPVQNRDAASLLDLIKRMHPKGEEIYADQRTNSLIFPNGVEQKYLDLMRELDQPESGKKNGPVAGADNMNALTELPIVGPMFGSNRALSSNPPSTAERDYRQFEAQCQALAAACREQQSAAPHGTKRIDQLKNELQGAVHSAFHARQAWQRQQAADLRQRLEQIERRISERSQMSNEIIQRRVDDLLNPQKQWEQDSSAAATDTVGLSPTKVESPGNPPLGNRIPAGGAGETADKSPADRGANAAQPDITESAFVKSATSEKCWETLGLRLQKAIPSQLAGFNYRYHGGMEIIEVRPQSAAAAAGMKQGDILVGLSNFETVRWQDIQYFLNQSRLINGGDPVKFYIIRGTEVLYGIMKPAAKGATSDGDRHTQTKPSVVDANANGNPLGRLSNDQRDPTRNIAQRTPTQSLGDPRSELLVAEAAVASAEAAVAESKAAYERSDSGWKRVQSLREKGAMPEKVVLDAQAEVERNKAALTRAESELEIKRRMSQSAREMLVLEVKLRQADVADAKLRMEHAAAELAQTENLYKQNVISQAEFESKKLPQQLAASQYERAKLLLDVYQQALSEQTPYRDATQAAGAPDLASPEKGAAPKPRLVDFSVTPAADDPRQRVRDAGHAVTSARAAVVAAEADVRDPELNVKRMQEANSKVAGTVPELEVARAKQAVARAQAVLQQKRVDLDVKQKQLDEAREMLDEKIKLLEIDLNEAKLRLEHAEQDLARAAELFKRASISVADYDAKRLAQRLAASQLERAQMLLDLYRKALTGQNAAAKDSPVAETVDKPVWLTDFAAAKEQAGKTGRPLFAFFSASWAAPCQKMKAEVLSDSQVAKLLNARFVAVIVDVDTNKDLVREFKITQVPTTLVLDIEGHILDRAGTIPVENMLNWLKASLHGTKPNSGEGLSQTTTESGAKDKPAALPPEANNPGSSGKPSPTASQTGKPTDSKPEE